VFEKFRSSFQRLNFPPDVSASFKFGNQKKVSSFLPLHFFLHIHFWNYQKTSRNLCAVNHGSHTLRMGHLRR